MSGKIIKIMDTPIPLTESLDGDTKQRENRAFTDSMEAANVSKWKEGGEYIETHVSCDCFFFIIRSIGVLN